MGKKVGIFGGTFDPIHIGHLILAEQARETLALDQVLFLPTSISPHKQSGATASEKDRLEMVHIAIAGNPTFAVSDLELHRGGISYTVETLESLNVQQPSDEWFLLIGADNLPDLPRWYRPERIVELAHLVVACRPGHPEVDFGPIERLNDSEAARTKRHVRLPIPLIGVSATEIRARRRKGKTVRYLVPSAVLAYMDSKDLYRDLA